MNPTFQDNFHAKVLPVVGEIRRPLWSVLIPTHNCANYLLETLQSVLAQDPGEEKMEIIVIDDCSSKDDPKAVVEEIGKGRVKFIQQEQNVGKVRNYETGLQFSTGQLIHQLHGDDKVRPGFYTEMEKILNENPKAGAAFFRTIYIDNQSRWTGMTGMVQDQEGIVPDILEKLYVEQYIQTPSIVVKREVYENLGGFDRRLNCMEDWEMWIRIANSYPIAISNKVLAEYRIHDRNATSQTFMDGSAIITHNTVRKIIDKYIEPEIRRTQKKRQNQKQAEFLLQSYRDIKRSLSKTQRWNFIKEIIVLDPSIRITIRLLRNIFQ